MCTANVLDTIPDPLRDRMEVLPHASLHWVALIVLYALPAYMLEATHE